MTFCGQTTNQGVRQMTTATASLTGHYTVDAAHSSINFGIRHVMVAKVRGSFKDFAGTGFLDIETPSNSKLELTIQSTSIDTGNNDRDAHLRSNDFFAMEEFPTITFVSTAFASAGGNTYKVTGDLTIKGISKSITIDLDFTGDAVDPYGNNRIGFEGSSSIDRTDFGVNFNAALETGGVMLGEKISLEFDISAIRNAEVA